MSARQDTVFPPQKKMKAMNSTFVRIWLQMAIVVLSGAMLGTGVRAQTSTMEQTTPFSFSISGAESGSGPVSNHVIAPVGSFTATFAPFDASLGTLISFTVAWDLTVTGSVGLANGMQIGTTGSGALELAGIGYSGTGGGNGGPTSASFTMSPSRTFVVAEAGSSYNPSIYEAVSGLESYSAYFDTGTTVGAHDYTDGETYAGTTIGSVTMTYTYSAVPEPSTYALLAASAMLLGALVIRRRRSA